MTILLVRAHMACTHVTHFTDVTSLNAHQASPHNLYPMQLQGFDADSDELLDTDIELVLNVVEELTEELIKEGSQMIINGSCSCPSVAIAQPVRVCTHIHLTFDTGSIDPLVFRN